MMNIDIVRERPNACCNDLSNLTQYAVKDGVYREQCVACGRNHYIVFANPGLFGLRLAGMGG